MLKNMKNFLKLYLTKNNLLILAIFIIAAGVRFYNFPNRVTFWSEQARSLMVSANYIKDKPSLLGQEYFRVDSHGHKMFSGAYFNYSLVPLLLISNYDPVVITAFFVLLNLFTGFVVYKVAEKIFGSSAGFLSLTLFLFNDLMIYHSLFIWNYNFLPLIGIIAFYFSYLFFKRKDKQSILILGIVAGFGISLQILFLFFSLLIYILNISRSKNKMRDTILFILGVTLGNLPMILFNARHDFYHLRTLFQYFIDTLHGSSDAGFAYYYLLPLWPLGAILVGWILSKINKTFMLVLIVVFLFVNLSSPKISWDSPTGMPVGLTTRDIDMASKIIAEDAEGDFNVSEVLDFDKRGYVLRYFIEFKYGKKPLPDTEYGNLERLYLLSPKDYNFDKSGVWEISVGGPYKTAILSGIGNGYAVYKLEK